MEHDPMSLLETVLVSQQLTSAVSFLHSCNVTHRDLKPANIMLASSRTQIYQMATGEIPPGVVVKLGDLGCADSTTSPVLVGSGTLSYFSPEHLQLYAFKTDDEEVFLPIPKAADTWAIGIIIAEMLTGTFTFELCSPSEEHTLILEWQYEESPFLESEVAPDNTAHDHRIMSLIAKLTHPIDGSRMLAGESCEQLTSRALPALEHRTSGLSPFALTCLHSANPEVPGSRPATAVWHELLAEQRAYDEELSNFLGL